MPTKFILPGLTLLALALSPAAMAAKPAKPPKPPTGTTAITIAAKPSIIVFSGATTLNGRLSGNASGVAVRLEQDDSRPYGDSYKPTAATTTTANNGAYAFTVKPLLNTQYRVVAQTSPPVTSPASLVRVRHPRRLQPLRHHPRSRQPRALLGIGLPRPRRAHGVDPEALGQRRLHHRLTDDVARRRHRQVDLQSPRPRVA